MGGHRDDEQHMRWSARASYVPSKGGSPRKQDRLFLCQLMVGSCHHLMPSRPRRRFPTRRPLIIEIDIEEVEKVARELQTPINDAPCSKTRFKHKPRKQKQRRRLQSKTKKERKRKLTNTKVKGAKELANMPYANTTSCKCTNRWTSKFNTYKADSITPP